MTLSRPLPRGPPRPPPRTVLQWLLEPRGFAPGPWALRVQVKVVSEKVSARRRSRSRSSRPWARRVQVKVVSERVKVVSRAPGLCPGALGSKGPGQGRLGEGLGRWSSTSTNTSSTGATNTSTGRSELLLAKRPPGCRAPPRPSLDQGRSPPKSSWRRWGGSLSM